MTFGMRVTIYMTRLKEKEKRSTWKDGGKDTPEIQLKTAFIEIDGQRMMRMNYDTKKNGC